MNQTMNLKLFFVVSLFLFNFIVSVLNEEAGIIRPVKPVDYPFLVLIECKSQGSDSNEYYNGALASLSWALTLSLKLAKEPSGKIGKNSTLVITVFAGLSTFSEISSTKLKRGVTKIISDMMTGDENDFFPNLVLLKLESAFPSDGHPKLRPASFNIGMLSKTSKLVGWAEENGKIMSQPMSLKVEQFSPKTCNQWSLVEYDEQCCSHPAKNVDREFNSLEGALLLDKGYITAFKQVKSYYRLGYGNVIILVRIGYYQSWLQYLVLDPVPEVAFFKTDFSDNIRIEPWVSDANSSGSRSIWAFTILAALSTVFMILY